MDLAHASSDPAFEAGDAAARLQWVPIRSLTARHRSRILVHLLALDGEDRFLRFGHNASDNQIGQYVDLLDFARDEVFGVFNRRLELVALAHLAYLGPQGGVHAAEFGVSVLARARGRGIGRRLMQRAVLHARNRGVDTLEVHALSENAAMLHIARSAGSEVSRDGADSQAVLKLLPDTMGSHVEAMIERQAAEFDYGWKRQARRIDSLIDMIAEVQSAVRNGGGIASQ